MSLFISLYIYIHIYRYRQPNKKQTHLLMSTVDVPPTGPVHLYFFHIASNWSFWLEGWMGGSPYVCACAVYYFPMLRQAMIVKPTISPVETIVPAASSWLELCVRLPAPELA